MLDSIFMFRKEPTMIEIEMDECEFSESLVSDETLRMVQGLFGAKVKDKLLIHKDEDG